MANRFEQVDEVVGDAITVALEQRPDGQWAKVVCPKSAHASFPADRVTESMPPKDALVGRRQARQREDARHCRARS